MASIGIFWVYRGSVIGVAEPLEEGEERVPGLFDTRLEHAQVWYASFMKEYRDLLGSEYSVLPRGRVLYSKAEGISIIYLDERLLTKNQKAKIARFFSIRAGMARWSSDLHYTTCRKTLGCLWG